MQSGARGRQSCGKGLRRGGEQKPPLHFPPRASIGAGSSTGHSAALQLPCPAPWVGTGPGERSGAKERPPGPLPHRRGRVPPHGSGISRTAVPGTPRPQAAQARCAAPGPYPGSRSPWRCPGPVQPPPPPPPPVTRSARAARPFRGGSRAQRVTAASPR